MLMMDREEDEKKNKEGRRRQSPGDVEMGAFEGEGEVFGGEWLGAGPAVGRRGAVMGVPP